MLLKKIDSTCHAKQGNKTNLPQPCKTRSSIAYSSTAPPFAVTCSYIPECKCYKWPCGPKKHHSWLKETIDIYLLFVLYIYIYTARCGRAIMHTSSLSNHAAIISYINLNKPYTALTSTNITNIQKRSFHCTQARIPKSSIQASLRRRCKACNATWHGARGSCGATRARTISFREPR